MSLLVHIGCVLPMMLVLQNVSKMMWYTVSIIWSYLTCPYWSILAVFSQCWSCKMMWCTASIIWSYLTCPYWSILCVLPMLIFQCVSKMMWYTVSIIWSYLTCPYWSILAVFPIAGLAICQNYDLVSVLSMKFYKDAYSYKNRDVSTFV